VPSKSTEFDSLVTFKNSQGVAARGTLSHVTRNQIIFEAYNPYSIVQLSEVLSDMRLLRGDRVLYSGRAVVSNIVATGLMSIVSATLVDPWSDLKGAAPGDLREEVVQFVNDFETLHAIRPAYQLTVTSVAAFLAELSRWLSQVEVGSNPTSPVSDQRTFISEIEQALQAKLNELFANFEQRAKEIPEEEVISHKSFARRQLHPLMMVSPFIHRTFTKPLGYAGDYEMVNMIARDPLEGPTIYAKVLNGMILRSDGAQAHRNRIDRLQHYLHNEAERVTRQNRPLRVLNIGCGPAQEIQRFIRNDPLSDRCEFHLMDFNTETLAYTRRKLTEVAFETKRNPSITYHHKSINELLKEATRGALGKETTPFVAADFIYCAGLFDYLNDKICIRLLQLFYNWVNEDGLVVATNVTPLNSVRYFLEHLLEWNLIYRGTDEMKQIAPVGRGEHNIVCDETEVNVFLEIRKTQGTA